MSHHLVRTRTVALLAAAALALALLPPGIAGAGHGDARGTANVCPPPGTAASPNAFSDDQGNTHEANINCAAAYGLVQGTGDDTYAPQDPITRAQMATFIANMLETCLGAALPVGSDRFVDDEDSVHEDNVNRLADAGIVQGTSATTYEPRLPVPRAQMATFIANAIDYCDDLSVDGEQPPPTDTDHFDDDGGVHEPNINRLHEQLIVVGTGGDSFSPSQDVTRAQMATFVMQGADYTAEIGAWAPVSNQAFRVVPRETAVLTVSDSAEPDRGRREYTARVVGVSTVDLALFPAENVAVGTLGTVTFRDADGVAGRADWAATAGRFELINNAAVTDSNGFADNVTPSDGIVTFTIDAAAADEVLPVVFVNTASNATPTLNLDGDDQPSVDFGVGGVTSWIPEEAQGGAFTIAPPDITKVEKEENLFVGTPDSGPDAGQLVTYFYDSNDSFLVDGVPATMATFEANLSRRDGMRVGSIYSPDEGAVSGFDLDDAAPAIPNQLTASGVVATQVVLTTNAPPEGGLVRAYQGISPGATRGNAALVAEATFDADAATAGFQIGVTNLAPGTTYEFWVTHVLDGDESPKFPASDDGLVVTTAGAAPPVSQTMAFTDNGPLGIGPGDLIVNAGDQLVITFDDRIEVADVWSMRIQDSFGTRVVVSSDVASATITGVDSQQVVLTLDENPTLEQAGETGATPTLARYDGEFLQVRSADGFSRDGVAWHLAASGEHGTAAPPTRTFVGSNATIIPRFPTPVRIDADADTVTVEPAAPVDTPPGSTIQAGEAFTVFDAAGLVVVQGTMAGTATAPQTTTVAASRDLSADETLFVTYVDSAVHVAEDSAAVTGASAVSASTRLGGPVIESVTLSVDAGADDNWDDPDDVLTVEWSQAATHADGDGTLTADQVEAILGTPVGYTIGTTVTLDGSGTDTWTLTVDGAVLAGGGVEDGEATNGTNNPEVTDGDGDWQTPATGVSL